MKEIVAIEYLSNKFLFLDSFVYLSTLKRWDAIAAILTFLWHLEYERRCNVDWCKLSFCKFSNYLVNYLDFKMIDWPWIMKDLDRKDENLHLTTMQIVILPVVKLPCRLPGLPYQIMLYNFLKFLMLCNHLFAFNIVQYKCFKETHTFNH